MSTQANPLNHHSPTPGVGQSTMGYGDYPAERDERFCEMTLDDVISAIKQTRGQARRHRNGRLVRMTPGFGKELTVAGHWTDADSASAWIDRKCSTCNRALATQIPSHRKKPMKT